MLPADWGEAYLFKANGTAKGYEMDNNGNLKETWDNIWAIKGDKLYITEDYDDDPYDKPETSVLEIINITSSKAVLYDATDDETIKIILYICSGRTDNINIDRQTMRSIFE